MREDTVGIHVFPPGSYYVGDPCYTMSHEDWDKLIENTGCFGIETGEEVINWNDGIFMYNGYQCFAGGTKHGDGLYKDRYGNSYSVDSGLISIMPMGAIKDKKLLTSSMALCVSIAFMKEFDVYARDGVFHFGNIVIDTR